MSLGLSVVADHLPMGGGWGAVGVFPREQQQYVVNRRAVGSLSYYIYTLSGWDAGTPAVTLCFAIILLTDLDKQYIDVP